MPRRVGPRSLARSSERARTRSRARLLSLGSLAFLFGAGCVAGLCFLHLWQTTRIHDLTASTQSAADRLADIEGVNRVLKVRIEEAFSLERIARIAREQLGMVEPTVIHYVRLPAIESD